jgi:hypothetical protein
MEGVYKYNYTGYPYPGFQISSTCSRVYLKSNHSSPENITVSAAEMEIDRRS